MQPALRLPRAFARAARSAAASPGAASPSGCAACGRVLARPGRRAPFTTSGRPRRAASADEAVPPAGGGEGATLSASIASLVRQDMPGQRPTAFSFSRRGENLRVDWSVGEGKQLRHNTRLLPYIWLRDCCRCQECVNPDTLQRAMDTFSIPKKIEPRKGADGLVRTPTGLKITWAQDNHVSYYPYEWLFEEIKQLERYPNRVLWGAEIADSPPTIEYDEIMASDDGVAKWTAQILDYGFSFVDGVPATPEKTQELLERITFIRETHYGGFYDFTADLSKRDTAYTTQRLRAHTDTTYFSDPIGFQMLHLLSHTEGKGGMSLLVDGFHAAMTLLKEDRHAFDALCDMPIRWHASGNEGVMITPSRPFPVLNVDDLGALQQVRWNNDDRGPLFLKSDSRNPSLEAWYDAARLWNQILRRRDVEYWSQLVPGRALIFDNWRVLHGRSEFTGKRRICGGYLNRDDFMSRWRTTNFKDYIRTLRMVEPVEPAEPAE